MKIAICFAGQLRFFQSVRDNLKEMLLSPLGNVDVFCHTWTSNLRSGTPHMTKEQIMEDLACLSPKNVQIDDWNDETFIQHPVLREKFKDTNDNWYGSRSPRTISHYYSVYACNELRKQFEKEQEIVYDYVIRVRYDMELFRPILSIQRLQEECSSDFFYMHNENSSNDVNPEIFFGGSDIMNKVCSMYTHFGTYFDQGVTIFDETVLSHHLKAMQIPVKRIDLHHLLRRQA